jgi:hypothetical protein
MCKLGDRMRRGVEKLARMKWGAMLVWVRVMRAVTAVTLMLAIASATAPAIGATCRTASMAGACACPQHGRHAAPSLRSECCCERIERAPSVPPVAATLAPAPPIVPASVWTPVVALPLGFAFAIAPPTDVRSGPDPPVYLLIRSFRI